MRNYKARLGPGHAWRASSRHSTVYAPSPVGDWEDRVAARPASIRTASLGSPAPAARQTIEPAADLAIIHAHYGAGKNWAVVTTQVRALVKDSKLDMVVPIRDDLLPAINFPDPAPNQLKVLVVVYSAGGKVGTLTVGPEERLELPPLKR